MCRLRSAWTKGGVSHASKFRARRSSSLARISPASAAGCRPCGTRPMSMCACLRLGSASRAPSPRRRQLRTACGVLPSSSFPAPDRSSGTVSSRVSRFSRSSPEIWPSAGSSSCATTNVVSVRAAAAWRRSH